MKGRLLAGAVVIAPAPADSVPPEPVKSAKPIATIGTMGKDTTRDQRKLHHRMKQDMKKAARNIRYDQLQKEAAATKE